MSPTESGHHLDWNVRDLVEIKRGMKVSKNSLVVSSRSTQPVILNVPKNSGTEVGKPDKSRSCSWAHSGPLASLEKT